MGTPTIPVDYIDLGVVADELIGDGDGDVGKRQIVTLSDAAAAAMSCCDKSDGACWTQM